MRVTCTQENLAAGISVVQRGVSARTTLPILTGILLEASGAGLRLSATDHEIGIQATVPGDVARPGAAVLPARTFGDMVRKLPPGEVELEVDTASHAAQLAWGRSQFVIHGYPPDEYPLLPETPREGTLSLDQGLLRDLVRRTQFAVSHDETRPVLTGALLTLEGDEARLVATDGFRMALARTRLDGGAGAGVSAIIPGRALSELGRLLDPGAGPARVHVGPNQAFFELGAVRCLTRLIDGAFPNYRQVIPQEYRTQVRVSTGAFLDACERAALISRDGPPVVRLDLAPGRMVVTSAAPEVGKGYEELPAEIAGEPLEIAFNARFLSDGLRALEAETAEFACTGPLTPARIQAAEGDGYFYIVLPLRTL